MKKYYYQITYKMARYSPLKKTVYYGENISDAKLYAFAFLGAYDVTSIIKVSKPLNNN